MNNFKVLKILLVISIVVIYTTCTFSAVINSSDGSAFITKAEFEGLKSDFDEQLSRYNRSIDEKIDGAIANYIAGIKVKKISYLKKNLDEYGKLKSGVYVLWNSSTSGYFGFSKNTDRLIIENLTVQFINSHSNGSMWGAAYRWKEYCPSDWGDGYTINDRKYLTSKKVKITLDDGSKISTGFQRMKVASYINWWYRENQYRDWANNYDYTWTPSAGENLNSQYNSVFQNSKNLFIQSNQNTDWLASASISVDTHDIADDGVSYTYDEIICPLSNANELYWDTEANSDCVVAYGGGESRQYSAGTRLSFTPSRPYGGMTANNPNMKISPMMTKAWQAPWLKKTYTVKNMYLYSLNQSDNRNRQVKNGMILGEVSKKGDYVIEAQSNYPGTLYAYIGKTPVDNWTNSSFKGKKITITETNKDYKLVFDDINFEEYEQFSPIWICFLPTDTSRFALLKISKFYTRSED